MKKKVNVPFRNSFGIHLDYAPSENCDNPDTYGYICVKCNHCGRFTPKREKNFKPKKGRL